jgi:hypothetical protein
MISTSRNYFAPGGHDGAVDAAIDSKFYYFTRLYGQTTGWQVKVFENSVTIIAPDGGEASHPIDLDLFAEQLEKQYQKYAGRRNPPLMR